MLHHLTLYPNIKSPGAQAFLAAQGSGQTFARFSIPHSSLLVLAERINDLVAESHRNLLAKQMQEKPERIGQYGDAFNGLFVYCSLPSNYDEWGMDETGEQWQFSFCRPDDFGTLVPVDPFYYGSECEQVDCY